MSYTTGHLIETEQFNTFAADINKVWGVGTGDYGYGQTNTISTVAATNTISATQWTSLLARGNSAAGHQGTTWSAGTSVTAGNVISVISALGSDVAAINANRLDANVGNLGISLLSSPTNSSTWIVESELIFTLTWADQDAARHYFNSGGKVQLGFGRSGGTAHSKNTGWTNTCTAAGTVTIGAHGVNKVGGSGSTSILTTTTGYYEFLTTDTNVFRQYDTTNPYTANYINVAVRTNTLTDPNSRGGRGNVLTITVSFVDAATDNSVPSSVDIIDGTFTTSIQSRRANTNYLSSPQPSNPTYGLTSWTTS